MEPEFSRGDRVAVDPALKTPSHAGTVRDIWPSLGPGVARLYVVSLDKTDPNLPDSQFLSTISGLDLTPA